MSAIHKGQVAMNIIACLSVISRILFEQALIHGCPGAFYSSPGLGMQGVGNPKAEMCFCGIA
jgi:hypothetical protein